MSKKALSGLGVVGVLILGSIAGEIGKEFGKAAVRPNKQEIEAKIVEGFTKAASENNQNLPMMIDKDTRLDKVTVGPGPRIVYHYTLPKYFSRDVDANGLRESLRLAVARQACSNADMEKSLQYGGIYAYTYAGSDGVEITRFEINNSDCSQ